MKSYDEILAEKLAEQGLAPESVRIPAAVAPNYKALSGPAPLDLRSLARAEPELPSVGEARSVRGRSIAEALPGVKPTRQPSWPRAQKQAEILDRPLPSVRSTKDIVEAAAPSEDLSFTGKVGYTAAQIARGIPHIGKALLVDAPLIGTQNILGALEETGVLPRTHGALPDLREMERTAGKVGEVGLQTMGYAGQQIRHPLKMTARDPLGTGLTLAGLASGTAGAVGDVAQTARLVKTLGAGGAVAGGSRVLGFAGPRLGGAAKAAQLPAGELSALLRTPRWSQARGLGKIEPAARAVQKVAGEVGVLPLRAALTPMPWLPASLPSRAAALAAKLPGGAEWMLGGPKRAWFSEKLLTRPEMEAAYARAVPGVGKALHARDAARFAGPEALAGSLHELESLPPAPHPLTGEPATMRQITSDLLEMPSDIEKARLRAEALSPEPVTGGEFVRRKLTREHIPEDLPTQESRGGFGVEHYEVDDAGAPTGREWRDPTQVPSDIPAALLRTRRVDAHLPPLPPEPVPLQLPSSQPFGQPGLPALQTEGIGVARHGPTTLPGPLPSAAAVGRAAEAGLARVQAGEPFLPPPAASPPPPRMPIPVMPPPGFSAVDKAMAQATGKAVPPGPPTLKPPPPLPRGDEFTMRAPRPEVAPPTAVQRLEGTTVPEVTPLGAPELPFLQPGMEVKARIRGVESAEQTAAREAGAQADLNFDRMTREAAVREREAARAGQAPLSPEVEQGLDVVMKGRTALDQMSQRLRQLGVIGETAVGENLGSYLVRGRSMKRIKETNPELYSYLQENVKKAASIEDPAQVDRAMRGVWRHLPAKVQRDLYGLVHRDYQEGMIATARAQADLLAEAEFRAALDTPEGAFTPTKKGPPPPDDWELVPATETPSGRPKYGSLAGKYIPPQHMRALKMLERWREWEPKGPWQVSADAWAALKILPPANIGGLFRNLYSFLAGQQVMGRLSAFPDYDGTASAVMKERLRGSGPHVDEFNLFGGGSTIYNPGAARAANVMAKTAWQKIGGEQWNFAKWFQAAADDKLTWKWWKSRGAEAGGELYGEIDLLGKNLAFSRLRNAQRAYAKGGESAVRSFRDVEAAFGPDEAVRLLSGGGKEAMEFAGYVGLAYDELPGASQWIAKNVSRFERFPAASSQQIASYLSRNPIHAKAVQVAGQMGDRMTYQLYWSNPEQGPRDMQMLREGLGEAMPLYESTGPDGKRKIHVLPLASTMPQAGLIPAEPKFVDLPGPTGAAVSYALSPLVSKLASHPVAGSFLDVLPMATGFPRVRVPRGPPLFSEDVVAPGTQDVSGLTAEAKESLVESDLAKRWGLPVAYHGVRAIRGLQGVADTATGEPVSIPEAALKGILGIGATTADMPTVEDRFGKKGKGAIGAAKAVFSATAKRAEEKGAEISPQQEAEFEALVEKYERQMAPLTGGSAR